MYERKQLQLRRRTRELVSEFLWHKRALLELLSHDPDRARRHGRIAHHVCLPRHHRCVRTEPDQATHRQTSGPTSDTIVRKGWRVPFGELFGAEQIDPPHGVVRLVGGVVRDH